MSPLPRACCAFAAVWALGCGGGTSVEAGPPPTYGFVPDLRGTSAMVLPVQLLGDESRREDADRELGFAVGEAGLDWLLPRDLERTLARSPGVDVQLRNLPVYGFGSRP